MTFHQLPKRRLFRGDRGSAALDTARWNVGTAIVGTRYSLLTRMQRRLRSWLESWR